MTLMSETAVAAPVQRIFWPTCTQFAVLPEINFMMPLQSRITIMVFCKIVQSLQRFRMADRARAMDSLILAIIQAEHEVVVVVIHLLHPKIGVPIWRFQGLVLIIDVGYPGTFPVEACEQGNIGSCGMGQSNVQVHRV